MSRPTVAVAWGPRSAANHWSQAAEQTIAAFAERVDVHLDPAADQAERERLVDAALTTADALVICGWGNLGLGYLSAERLARAPRLRFIGSTCHYRQAEFVDMAAALARGIAFSETAPIMSPWVAEYELLLCLAALRRMPREHALVGSGGWAGLLDLPDEFDRLHGRRVGLASFGEIHRHLAGFWRPSRPTGKPTTRSCRPSVSLPPVAARPPTWWRWPPAARSCSSPRRRRRRRSG